MDKLKIPKNWKIIEIQISQASEFLNDPSLFIVKEFSIESYAQNTRETELTALMLKLEEVAKKHGCKTGFWRRIKKVAIQLELPEKIKEYEREFHASL